MPREWQKPASMSKSFFLHRKDSLIYDAKIMSEESIQSEGGKARAESLTPIQRQSIAANAALTRWGKLPISKHKGSFQEEFGIDADCYVWTTRKKLRLSAKRVWGKPWDYRHEAVLSPAF